MHDAAARDEAHARLLETLPHLFRRLVVSMPNEVEGLAKVTTEQYGVLNQILERGSLSMSELAVARNVALTRTGVSRSSVVASPSCPRSLLPQQYASPSRETPQVCVAPALSWEKLRSPETDAGSAWSSRVPSPSWP